jgi:hypothetical protein
MPRKTKMIQAGIHSGYKDIIYTTNISLISFPEAISNSFPSLVANFNNKIIEDNEKEYALVPLIPKKGFRK